MAAVCLWATVAGGGQTAKDQSGTWAGTLFYSSCNADEAFAESAECIRSVPDAKLSLFDDTSRVMYSLEPQERVAGRLGESVTVHGTLDGDLIHIDSIQVLSIGLATGQKAPAFSARDQLGREETLDTLKGPNGTVLLFFRSADW